MTFVEWIPVHQSKYRMPFKLDTLIEGVNIDYVFQVQVALTKEIKLDVFCLKIELE
jgi:hypothetical protein